MYMQHYKVLLNTLLSFLFLFSSKVNLTTVNPVISKYLVLFFCFDECICSLIKRNAQFTYGIIIWRRQTSLIKCNIGFNSVPAVMRMLKNFQHHFPHSVKRFENLEYWPLCCCSRAICDFNKLHYPLRMGFTKCSGSGIIHPFRCYQTCTNKALLHTGVVWSRKNPGASPDKISFFFLFPSITLYRLQII